MYKHNIRVFSRMAWRTEWMSFVDVDDHKGFMFDKEIEILILKKLTFS